MRPCDQASLRAVPVECKSFTIAGVRSTPTRASARTAAMQSITAAIDTVATNRGSLGAGMNRLQSATNVTRVQAQTMQEAEDSIRAANIAEEIMNMTRLTVLSQTGIVALQQANTSMRAILSLLR